MNQNEKLKTKLIEIEQNLWLTAPFLTAIVATTFCLHLSSAAVDLVWPVASVSKLPTRLRHSSNLLFVMIVQSQPWWPASNTKRNNVAQCWTLTCHPTAMAGDWFPVYLRPNRQFLVLFDLFKYFSFEIAKFPTLARSKERVLWKRKRSFWLRRETLCSIACRPSIQTYNHDVIRLTQFIPMATAIGEDSRKNELSSTKANLANGFVFENCCHYAIRVWMDGIIETETYSFLYLKGVGEERWYPRLVVFEELSRWRCLSRHSNERPKTAQQKKKN